MPESIHTFITRKRETLQKYPQLTAFSHLITVDGPDGSGKSSISKQLTKNLADIYGEQNVCMFTTTNLKGSADQDRLFRFTHDISDHISPQQIDGMYVAGVNRAYGELIIPALTAGKIVVCDRSEIDLLRYALESKDEHAIQKRLQYLTDGTMTHRFWAGNRVFVSSSPEELWGNLVDRGELSSYDPHSVEEAAMRLFYETESEHIVEQIPCQGQVQYIRVQNKRIGDKEALFHQINNVVRSIIEKIRI
jgi:hypothetical protein